MAVKIAAGAPQANAWTAPVITATVSLPGGVSIGDLEFDEALDRIRVEIDGL